MSQVAAIFLTLASADVIARVDKQYACMHGIKIGCSRQMQDQLDMYDVNEMQSTLAPTRAPNPSPTSAPAPAPPSPAPTSAPIPDQADGPGSSPVSPTVSLIISVLFVKLY